MSLLGRSHQGGHQTKAGAVRLPRDCLLWEHDWGGHDQMSPPRCSADRGRSKSKKKQMQPREGSFFLQWLPSALYWQSSTSPSGGETQKSLVFPCAAGAEGERTAERQYVGRSTLSENLFWSSSLLLFLFRSILISLYGCNNFLSFSVDANNILNSYSYSRSRFHRFTHGVL